MSLDHVRRIRGSISGSIDITQLEDFVIAHPWFQRLRRVRQTAFLNLVFPGASHSRFEHSIGVMHLAGVAWNKIKQNQTRLELATKKFKDFAVREETGNLDQGLHGLLHPTFEISGELFKSDYVYEALRLAALMHDMGHAPFSHSGERFLPSAKTILEQNSNVPPYLKLWLTEKSTIEGDKPVSHEVFTILIIDQVLREVYASYPEIALKIEPQDVISIINPKIAPSAHSPLSALKAQKLCHELISGEVDIDRMDYLARDSKEAGVVYGIFDGDRILDSLCIYFDSEEKNLHLAIQFSGLAAFEDYLRARQSMYLQLYFHKTSVAAEAMLQYVFESLSNWRLPGNITKFCAADEWNIVSILKEQAELRVKDLNRRAHLNKTIDDLILNRNLWKRVYEISGSSNAVAFDPSLEHAKKILSNLGIEYQQISSASYLTRFRERKPNEMSSNYLRLIKKDSKLFPRVVPIEDFSNIVSQKTTVHISRLYIEQIKTDRGDSVELAKSALIDGLEND
jgi:HD superfamily phosphohydrolase